jgi:hypothetical protein
VHGVFTRIRSGATAVASYDGALGSTIFSTAAARTGGDSWLDLLGMATNAWGEKTLRVLASIYKSTAALQTAGWISLRMADSAVVPDSSRRRLISEARLLLFNFLGSDKTQEQLRTQSTR